MLLLLTLAGLYKLFGGIPIFQCGQFQCAFVMLAFERRTQGLVSQQTLAQKTQHVFYRFYRTSEAAATISPSIGVSQLPDLQALIIRFLFAL